MIDRAMASASFNILGSHGVVNFYFDRPSTSSVLIDVCKRLLARSDLQSKASRIAYQSSFPLYGSDDGIDADVSFAGPIDTGTVAESNEQYLAFSFASQSLGNVVVAYEAVKHPEYLGKLANPIGVTLDASLIEMATFTELSASELRRAGTQAEFMTDTLRYICDEMQPLYAGITVESSFPDLVELSYPTYDIYCELYLSNRVLSTGEELSEELQRAYSGAFIDQWRDGRYYSSWEPFNPAHVTLRPTPLRVDSPVRGVLSAAFKRFIPCIGD